MDRSEGIKLILSRITNDLIVANLGPTTFDLHFLGDRPENLYSWGGMGLVSSIALGIAVTAPSRRVIALDGEGSLLMNLGSLATIARQSPSNLIHIVWDNQQWGETGGQPTHTAFNTDLSKIAEGAGIPNVSRTSTIEEFSTALDLALSSEGPSCIVARIVEAGKADRPEEVEPNANLIRFRNSLD